MMVLFWALDCCQGIVVTRDNDPYISIHREIPIDIFFIMVENKLQNCKNLLRIDSKRDKQKGLVKILS